LVGADKETKVASAIPENNNGIHDNPKNSFGVLPPASPPSLGSKPTTVPIVFGFEGEYSIISLRETGGGKLQTEATWRRVGRVVKKLERITGLRFRYVFGVNPFLSLCRVNLRICSPAFLCLHLDQADIFFHD
jgi:hypothetical protein